MSSYESPRYDVLLKEGDFEIRKYEEFHTTSVNEANLQGYGGFNLLFGYISGENKANEKMAMTVPVINEIESNQMTMEFVVPSQYTKETIPQPLHPRVKVKTYPAHIAAVVSYFGNNYAGKVDGQIQRLMDWVQRHQWRTKGAIRLARYNPPFSLPFFKHNEVTIELDTDINTKFS